MNRLLSAAGALLCVALSVAVPACAQTNTTVGLTQPTATNLKISGFKIPSGFVTFTPTDKNGIPLTISDYTGSQSGPEAIECQVTNGAITGALQENGSFSGNCLVPDSTLTVPANIEYTAQVCDTSTGNVTSGKCYSVQGITGLSGLTWALDHYGPPASTSNAIAPALSSTLSPAAQNSFWAGPSTGGAGTPGYRVLTAADIAVAGTLPNSITGNAATATSVPASGLTGTALPSSITSAPGLTLGPGSGLTSFTTSSLAPLFSSTLGVNPTTAPALAFTPSAAAQNSVLAGPTSGGTGAYSFRSLVAADIAAAGTISNPTTGNAATASAATTAGNLSGTPALPNGTTATTQTAGDTTTKLATDAFATAAATAAAAASDPVGTAAKQILVVNTNGVGVPQSGTTPCASLQGCIVYDTEGAAVNSYYEAYGSSTWINTTNQTGVAHAYTYAQWSLLPPTLFQPNTSVDVVDCLTTNCLAGGGTIREAYTNGTAGTTWTLQVYGQGAGSGSGVTCFQSVAGSASATLSIACPDETILYSLGTGNNTLTLTGDAQGNKHHYIFAQNTLGNGYFTPMTTENHGFPAMGTNPLSDTTATFFNADGTNYYPLSAPLQNIPTSYTNGTATVGAANGASAPVIGLSYGKNMLARTYCPFCAASKGNIPTRMIGLFEGAGITHLRMLNNESAGNLMGYVSSSPAGNVANNEYGNLDIQNFANFACAIKGYTPAFTVSWGLNYLNNTTANAVAEAQYVWGLLGPSGTACSVVNQFEIGNEPDGYGVTAAQFATGWNTYATAVKSAIPAAVFAAPSVGIIQNIPAYLPTFMATNASLLAGGTLTQHYYREGTVASATIAGLLTNAPDPNVVTYAAQLESQSAANGNLPIDINEGSTVANGGAPGVSNTSASAFYAVTNAYDWAQLASGGGPVSLDYSAGGGPLAGGTYAAGYSPFVDSSSIAYPNPEAMGLLLLHLIGSGQMRSCSSTVSGVNVRCYQVGHNTVLLNQDQNSTANITVSLPYSVSTATEIEMTTPTMASTSEPTIQGASMNNVGSFTLGASTSLPVTAGNSFTALVPLSSIVVVTAQ